jgi:hypothetical protein
MAQSAKMNTVNIEAGKPDVQTACMLVDAHIATARRQGIKILKLIHGYGSSGVGGVLRTKLRKYLQEPKFASAVEYIIPGERWEIFDAQAQKLLQKSPEMSKDSDLGRCNHGITIVVLK